MSRIGTVNCLTLASAALAFSQPAPTLPSFEVASVKVSVDRTLRPAISISGSRFIVEAKNFLGLVLYAYDLRSYQVARTPALAALEETRYDIAARTPDGLAPTTAQVRQMLQSLLASRFQLQAHREKREMPVYQLVVAKNGPKFTVSAPQSEHVERYAASGRNYEVTLAQAAIADLLGAIENSLIDRPVVDRTGLKGSYDIKITYTPQVRGTRETDADPQYISIFAAVEALGLKLVPEKSMVELLVIDHAAKPSENE